MQETQEPFPPTFFEIDKEAFCLSTAGESEKRGCLIISLQKLPLQVIFFPQWEEVPGTLSVFPMCKEVTWRDVLPVLMRPSKAASTLLD